LTYTENTGAAFSMGTGYTWIFSTVAVVVAVVILRSARRLGSLGWAVALGGLLGGLLGNLIDRITRPPGPGLGYVVDWIQLPNFAVFNVADMAIVGSAALMVLLALRGIDFAGGPRS
jgi:signal peptidase II